MTDVAVIGGGLAGLVAARHLAETDLDVRLFERRSQVGGRVRTRHRAGFTLDRGFQVLFTGYPAVRRELDLYTLNLRWFAPGATIAGPGHRSILTDPIRDPGCAVQTLLNDEIRQVDKFRMFALQRDLRRRAPETIFPGPDRSIEEYLADRGFSRAFVETFAAPFYGGITLDRSLSTAAAVFEYTFKMLTEGRIAVPAAGMGAIPDQLAEHARAAGASIETDSEVTEITADEDRTGGDGVSNRAIIQCGGETISADAAVVATDPRTARSLTGIETIPTNGRGCVTQYYALSSTVDLDTGKRLLLNASSDQPNHVAPLSAVAPEYAPAGRQLLAATFLGQPDATDTELADQTSRELASWYPDTDFGGLEAIHTDRIRFAQFAQPPGIHKQLPDIAAPDWPIYLAGDYTRWSSIQGALESGQRAADAILQNGLHRSAARGS